MASRRTNCWTTPRCVNGGMSRHADHHLDCYSTIASPQITIAVRESVQSVIHDQHYSAAKTDTWTNGIIEAVLGKLVALNRPFKYVVTVLLTQKAGAGMHCAAMARWNPATDGRTSVLWENTTVQALVTVFWVAI